MCDKAHILGFCLSHQHPVKRIMMRRSAFRPCDGFQGKHMPVSHLHRQKTGLPAKLRKIFSRELYIIGMQSMLNRNFPDRYGAVVNRIVCIKNQLSCLLRQPGIIIRNGEVRWDKTKAQTAKAARQRPCLDTLAVYSDGSMKTYLSDAMTAEEYLEKGAEQVFAFGPWLISEGKINEKEAVEGCGYYEQMEPLTGLGMIEPYHYIAIVLKGRPKTKYAGAHLSWLADRLLEYGCTEAINLDGGGTACMFFNGKAVITGQENLRSMGGMIAFGLKDE